MKVDFETCVFYICDECQQRIWEQPLVLREGTPENVVFKHYHQGCLQSNEQPPYELMQQ